MKIKRMFSLNLFLAYQSFADSCLIYSRQIFVVQSRQQNSCNSRTDETPEHVGLRIPDVALCSQKSLRVRGIGKGGQPLDDLIERRKSKGHSYGHEVQPLSRPDRRSPGDDFTGVNGRAKSLHEMPDFIVIVACPAKPVLHPEA